MEKSLQFKTQNLDWYLTLIDELRALIVEGVFISRWELVKTYHKLGESIIENKDNFLKAGFKNEEEIVQRVAVSLGKGERTVWYAVQFFNKYPDLDTLPEGKNISWSKIVHKYLPQGKKHQCTNYDFIRAWKCVECSKICLKK